MELRGKVSIVTGGNGGLVTKAAGEDEHPHAGIRPLEAAEQFQ